MKTVQTLELPEWVSCLKAISLSIAYCTKPPTISEPEHSVPCITETSFSSVIVLVINISPSPICIVAIPSYNLFQRGNLKGREMISWGVGKQGGKYKTSLTSDCSLGDALK